MILTDEEIVRIINENPYSVEFAEKVKVADRLRMHKTGIGLEKAIYDMPFFERPELKKERQQMTMSCKDMVNRILRPRDKVFTAKGGFERYDLGDEKQEAGFKQYLSTACKGQSVKKWIFNVLINRLDTDPMGLCFVEIDAYGAPYPTYKSIYDILCYENSGRKVEWVIFRCSDKEIFNYVKTGQLAKKPEKGEQVFRVVDDAFDKLVVKGSVSNSELTVRVVDTMPNYFGRVPALIISDINGYIEDEFISPLDPISDLLDTFLLNSSTYSVAYMRNVYPQRWMVSTDCFNCGGEGTVGGAKCPECKGTGKAPSLKQSDVLLVAVDGDGKSVPTPPGGTLDNDIECVRFMNEQLIELEDRCYFTLWGTYKGDKLTTKAGKGGNTSNTAYEAQLNTQPQNDRLSLFADWYSDMMTFVTELMGGLIYQNKFKGTAFKSGDRYMIESPDQIFIRYNDAVKAGSPQSVLDSILTDYIENKYGQNPIQERKQKLLMAVEPFVHYNIDQVMKWENIPMIQKLEKQYFDEWTSTLDDTMIVSVGDNGEAKLREMLREYVEGKFIKGVQDNNKLLENAFGTIYKVGDTVSVKAGKEQDKSHAGIDWQVKSIDPNTGNYVLSTANGMIYSGYTPSNLQYSVNAPQSIPAIN